MYLGITPSLHHKKTTINPHIKQHQKTDVVNNDYFFTSASTQALKAYSTLSFKGDMTNTIDFPSIVKNKLANKTINWSVKAEHDNFTINATTPEETISLCSNTACHFSLKIKGAEKEESYELSDNQYDRLLELFRATSIHTKDEIQNDLSALLANLYYKDLNKTINWNIKNSELIVPDQYKKVIKCTEKSYTLPDNRELSFLTMFYTVNSLMGKYEQGERFVIIKSSDSPLKVIHMCDDFVAGSCYYIGLYFKDKNVDFRLATDSEIDPFYDYVNLLFKEDDNTKTFEDNRSNLQFLFDKAQKRITEPLPEGEVKNWLKNKYTLDPFPASKDIEAWLSKCEDTVLAEIMLRDYLSLIDTGKNLQTHIDYQKQKREQLLKEIKETYKIEN